MQINKARKFGEIDWIEYLKKKVKKSKDVLVGIGDDSALVKIKKERILLKSDLFIEDVHFNLKQINFKTIGMRAVARVISDFVASGGWPEFIGVSLGKPSYINKKHLEKILSGILQLSKKYKFSLIGGDTSYSNKLFLDVWGIGYCEKFIARNTAKIGDYIFITGRLGSLRFNQAFFPKVDEVVWLIKNFKINSMIDISDGFILDLYRIIKESKKGAVVYKDKIPITEGESDLYRGEDYEIIFTVDKTEPKLKLLEKKFYLVGEILDKKFGYKFRVNKKDTEIFPVGYSHF